MRIAMHRSHLQTQMQTPRPRRGVCICIILAVLMLAAFVADMAVGSVSIGATDIVRTLAGMHGDNPMLERIIVDIRLVKAVVALAAGAALSVSGLQMQTVFHNPLAGPYVLGITGGASLGVALMLLGAPVLGLGALGQFGIAGAAWAGSAAVLAVIALASRRIRDIMAILILGMMFSAGVGAVVQILQYLSNEQALKSYVMWTMGSLGEVTRNQLWLLLPAVAAGLGLAFAAVKPLNMMQAGDETARSLGLNLRLWRTLIFTSTVLLAGSITAFCGPIGFIGLAMPHVARMLTATGNQRVLLPATLLTGATAMIVCDIVAKLYTIPINAVTALLGIPIVMWIVVESKA